MEIIPTNGVDEITPIHGINYQAELYRPYIYKMFGNPFKYVIEYDQKKDKSCVVMSALGCIGYNCGLDFTNEEGREIWQEHQGDKGGETFKTSREIGQRFILNTFPIFINTPEFEMYLSKGWSAQVVVWCDPKFLLEGLMTGKITKVMPGRGFIHAMVLYKKENRYYLQNSWKGLEYPNTYDITDIYQDCIKMIFKPYAMALLPYFAGTRTTTIKDHTRALKSVGVEIVGDVWKTFKNKFAKVDGKVDKM